MAGRVIGNKSLLMQSHSRIIAYLPSIRSVVRHFRAFSSYDEQEPKGIPTPLQTVINDPHTDWPDTQLGPLSPQHRTFPLPGLVGRAGAHKKQSSQPSEPDIFTTQLSHERHMAVIEEYLNTAQQMAEEDALASPEMAGLDNLECVALKCPQLIRKDFQDLFPEQDLMTGDLTIMTISHKTHNDMSGWSPEVDQEREELLENFVTGANEICEAIQEAGFWADFIDPSSGRPYLGAYTNATLYETDERYRHLGFEIEDLGCCKVISHHIWGTHSYVGCLFTNAPLDHSVIQQMIQKHE